MAEPPKTEPPYVPPNDYANGIVSIAGIVEEIEEQFGMNISDIVGNNTNETNADTGKNNHKWIITSIGNQIM